MNKNVEDIYPLSPIQEGMLFQEIYEPGENVYLVQISCRLHGELDVAAFRRAWEEVLKRHQALRTAFVWKKTPKPLQVVGREPTLPFRLEDWSHLAEVEQKARLEAFLQEDRAEGFELSRPPLLRVALMKLAPETHAFVWTLHHLVVDGWSYPMVLGEVLTAYDTLTAGKELKLAPRRPFRDYIA
ncbi:MAG: non-ribosomal peptide synthetase, partial [Acidobacteria bacterium]|nr:non-ribosomal peptide synthetase [Acidobacteriota bacterium]